MLAPALKPLAPSTLFTPSIIVQSDYTVLLERQAPGFEAARDFLVCCAELEKCPEYYFSYRITRLSLWNAAALGLEAEGIIDALTRLAKFPVPSNVISEIRDSMALWGQLRLLRIDGNYWLEVREERLAKAVAMHPHLRKLMVDPTARAINGLPCFEIQPEARGQLKVELIKLGYPVEDLAGFTAGEPFELALRPEIELRPYQIDAVQGFHRNDPLRGGSGVIVLPCGAGKTVIGMALMAHFSTSALIIVPTVSAARQWRAEILAKTTCKPEDVAEYSGQSHDIAPITIATYQILSTRRAGKSERSHLQLFEQRDWGLIVYDEVHLLPAPLFKLTASIQARRRLGLTATLIREDRREPEVFCLIGPKRFDMPWRVLETQGWIATARCFELRVPADQNMSSYYEAANKRERFRIAAVNANKQHAVAALLQRHAGEKILIIGMYLQQLEDIAQFVSAPLLDGRTPQKKRDQLFSQFRDGDLNVLVISRVGNFSIDLPEASVAIEVSGLFGSRQEEAQRMGRVLRPKQDGKPATFYVLVTAPSVEQEFAMHRQLFLVEQGYEYQIIAADSALPEGLGSLPNAA